MKRAIYPVLAGLGVMLLGAASALASHEEVHEAVEHTESAAYSWPLIRGVLLLVLWVTVAAILLGPLVKWLIGDIWERKTTQPFTDDAGGHGHGHTAPAAHGVHH